MKTSFIYKAKGQRGFTLVELVVVIAIIGVLSAVAVPFIASHLGESKERAYEVDRERFQQAVDAFYSRPANLHYLGRPQYPIMGMDKTTRNFVKENHNHRNEGHLDHNRNHGTPGGSVDHIAILTPLGNPLGGTQGGSPRWIDGPFSQGNALPEGNGIRDGSEEELLDNDATSLDKPGWHVATVNRQGTRYIVDTRDYFIDFTKLAALGLLEEVPLSASPDNKPKDPPQSIFLGSNNLTPGGLTITPPTSTLGVSLWVVTEGSGENSRRVFQFSLLGDRLGGFDLSDDNDKAKGITTDGTSFWVLDRRPKGKVFRYDLDMEGVFRESDSFLPNSVLHPSLDKLEGIALLGNSLWILDKDKGLFRYNTSGDYQEEFFTIPDVNHPEGIATDGERFWVVDESGLVYQFTISGTPTGVPFFADPSGHPEGIATDGSNIWVVDKATHQIYPFGLDGGAPEPVTGVYPGSYSWYVDPDGKVKSKFFYLPEPDSTGFQTAYP